MTGRIPAGSVLVDGRDVPLLAWAVGEAVRSMRVGGRTVPRELLRLLDLVSCGTESVSGAPVESLAPSMRDEITTAEAALRMKVSQARVRQLVAAGELPARRAGARVLLLPAAAVEVYLQERVKGA